MEKLTKPKLKAKSSDSPLFWQSKYEFVVPYSMDECIRRINALGKEYRKENRKFFASDRFYMDSQQDNGGVFNFKMSARRSKAPLTGQLLGNLIYDNDQQTNVKVRTGFTWTSAIFFIAELPFWFIMLLITTHSSNIVEIAVCFGISTAIFGMTTFIGVGWGYPIKSQLYYDLREALIPSEVPRPRY